MPYWNTPGKAQLKHVPQPQFEIEMPERVTNDDIDKFLKEKGWLKEYDSGSGTQIFSHPDFDSPRYFEWHEAVAMEMIRFMRIGISA